MENEKYNLSFRDSGSGANTETDIIHVDTADLRMLIYTVRNKHVMLDSDLATLYQVETKALNQAVTRNPERFPASFCFRLSVEEWECLRSQTVTSNTPIARGGRRYIPRVFTEQGIAMLSAVLRSRTAIEISVRIMDAFVEMRRFLVTNSAVLERISRVELQHTQLEKSVSERFERVFAYMESCDLPRQRVFFEGQIYDAFELLTSLVRHAKKDIALVDSYVDNTTLNILAKKASGVSVTLWTRSNTKLTKRDVTTFNKQYPKVTVHYTDAFHDRFLIVDKRDGYLIGASLKDAGKRCFAITRIEDESIVHEILERLEKTL